MPDTLKITLWVGFATVVLGLACLGIVAWTNSGSRNLALAMSTLVAAVVLFSMQLRFELRSRTETGTFAAELTIDRSSPQIRLWTYPDFPDVAAQRLTYEAAASAYLAQHDRARFDGDRDRLNTDLVLHSLIAFLSLEQFDWQLKRTAIHGATTGTEVRTERGSGEGECTAITPAQLHALFVAAGNAFAQVPLSINGGRLCLPPNSAIRITDRELEIRTPYCTITLTVEPSRMVSYAKPGSGGDVPHLESGDAQYETRLTVIRSARKFSWIRAQARDMEKYVEWSERVVRGAKLWFEGRTERAI